LGENNLFFLEFIEWFDETGKEIVHRIPEQGSGEIKWGAQLVVREYQAAVFFYKGKALDAIGPGRHALKTGNIPVLNKLLAIPWAMNNPLRTEVYFVNMNLFTDLKWGTRDPVAFKDSELGLVRLRAFGIFNMRVLQPVLFVNTMVGAQGAYSTADVEEYLGRVIVSRLNDVLGEKVDTMLNLPKLYDEMAEELMKRLAADFNRLGLGLDQLYINSITPPQEVQQAIDDRSKLSALKDLNAFIKMKAAASLENVSRQTGGHGTAAGPADTMASTMGAGMGLGMGFMMPSMFAGLFKDPAKPELLKQALVCPECGNPIAADAKFCTACGHQLMVVEHCGACGTSLPPAAKFCPHCGAGVDQKPAPRKCPHCGSEALKEATYCNHCGEKL
jgi:membrane protease subunit (stomatin/prohibitin family)